MGAHRPVTTPVFGENQLGSSFQFCLGSKRFLGSGGVTLPSQASRGAEDLGTGFDGT